MISSPFDVAKSREQAKTLNCMKKPDWAVFILKDIYKKEGISAFYRGFVAKVLRLGLGGGILIFSFEYVLSMFEFVYLLTAQRFENSHTTMS